MYPHALAASYLKRIFQVLYCLVIQSFQGQKCSGIGRQLRWRGYSGGAALRCGDQVVHGQDGRQGLRGGDASLTPATPSAASLTLVLLELLVLVLVAVRVPVDTRALPPFLEPRDTL